MDRTERLIGCILGTAVGDAVGLPAEGLSRRRVAHSYPGAFEHRLIFGRGMWSDDTEHTIFVAQALLESDGSVVEFRRRLARKLRWWLVGLPAGVGFATLRSILKLWFGVAPNRSGVWSAGNGPAMRSALLGVVFCTDEAARNEHVLAATRMTHSDPRAATAALAVAELAACFARGEDPDPVRFVAQLRGLGDDPEWATICDVLSRRVADGSTIDVVAHDLSLERGVSGYAYHTVPIALFAALISGSSPRQALEQVYRLGGDTDTVGAIVGGLVGAKCGEAALPSTWVRGLWEWPRTVAMLREIARRLAVGECESVRTFLPGVMVRNLIFLTVVLCHGFARLIPHSLLPHRTV